MKVEVPVKKGGDIRPVGCDVPPGQVRGGEGREGRGEGEERRERERG